MKTWVLHTVAIGAMTSSTVWAGPEVDVARTGSQVVVESRIIESLPINRLGINWFFQDVTAATPNSGGFINQVDGAAIGAGLTFRHRLSASSGWFLDGQAGYGAGATRWETGPPLNLSDRISLKAYYGQVGFGYEVPITTKVSAYGLGGVQYLSTTGTFDNGSTEVDGEPFNVFGLSKSLGGYLQLNDGSSLFAEQYSTFGWGSAEDKGAKYRTTVKYGCYRAGLLFSF